MVRSEINVDEIEQVFRRIHVQWHRMTDGFEILADGRDGTFIAKSAFGEETDFVKKVERGCGWLMNTGNDNYLFRLESSAGYQQAILTRFLLATSRR